MSSPGKTVTGIWIIYERGRFTAFFKQKYQIAEGPRSLSQIELAEKANISIPFLSNIERQNKRPHPDTLAKLAKALDVEAYVLFQDKAPPLPANMQEYFNKIQKGYSGFIAAYFGIYSH